MSIMLNFQPIIEYVNELDRESQDRGLLHSAEYAFGVISEWNELQEKINNDESKNEIVKEIGDVLWYVLKLVNCVGLTKNTSIFNLNETNLSLYQRDNVSHSIFEFAQWGGKLLRKDFEINNTNRLVIPINRTLGFIVFICSAYSITVEDMIQVNKDKIKDRKSRNAIHGDGDNR